MLIDCPECKSQVSDKASSCPKCGCPMTKVNNHTIIPKCPTCGSTNIGKISLKSKVGMGALVGVFAIGHIAKTFKCNSCGAKW
jgi:hypothetical protein